MRGKTDIKGASKLFEFKVFSLKNRKVSFDGEFMPESPVTLELFMRFCRVYFWTLSLRVWQSRVVSVMVGRARHYIRRRGRGRDSGEPATPLLTLQAAATSRHQHN